DHDSISGLKEWLVYDALIGNNKLSFALFLSLHGTVGGIIDDGKFSRDDGDLLACGLCLKDASTQLNSCWFNLAWNHAPMSKIKIMLDAFQGFRGKDLIRTSTAYKTEQKSLEKGLHTWSKTCLRCLFTSV